ncbi:MAG: hypothetical protein R3245_06325, partial [Kiloniellales bacterium]|nr:hypothetical protein [Kiloniellales bacterium]
MSLEVSADRFSHPAIAKASEPAFEVVRRSPSGVAPGPSAKREQALFMRSGNELGDRAYRDLPERELTFGEFLDVINPLQHIPVVSTFYREATGDEISASSRSLGGFIYGGPVGLLAGTVNGIVADTTGQDVGQHLAAALIGEEGPEDPSLVATVSSGTRGSSPLLPLTGEAVSSPGPEGKNNPALTSETLTGVAALEAFFQDTQGSEPEAGLQEDRSIQMSAGHNEDLGPPTPQSGGSQLEGHEAVGYSLEGVPRTTLVNSRPPAAAVLPGGLRLPEGETLPVRVSLGPDEEIVSAASGEAGSGGHASRMLEALQKYETML